MAPGTPGHAQGWWRVRALVMVGCVAVARGAPGASPPLGCYHYGYQYLPPLQKLPHNPVTTDTVEQCQAICGVTQGCTSFTYFRTPMKCWLAGANSALAVAKPGTVSDAVSGPVRCQDTAPACSEVPRPGFPGKDRNESRSAWRSGDQPTSLQCWPRGKDGIPAGCGSVPVRVVEDTRSGWPGQCKGMKTVSPAQLGGDTCQANCMRDLLCAVWLLERDGSSAGGVVCKHGIKGHDCYRQDGVPPIIAQRLVHGSVRVLMNSAGMRIDHLVKAFGPTLFPKWREAEGHCRFICYSYILCQFWQYSETTGCWVEDPRVDQVAYPLVDDGVGMSMSNGDARQIRAGEYVQHGCAMERLSGEPGMDLPELFAAGTLFGSGVTTTSTTTLIQDSPATSTAPLGGPGWQHMRHAHHLAGSLSWKWVVPLCILVALCIGGSILAAVLLRRRQASGGEGEEYRRHRWARQQTRNCNLQQTVAPPYGASPQPHWGPYQNMPPGMHGSPGGAGGFQQYPPFPTARRMSGPH